MKNLELRKALELYPDDWDVKLYPELPINGSVYDLMGGQPIYVHEEGELGINLDGVHDYEKFEFIAN